MLLGSDRLFLMKNLREITVSIFKKRHYKYKSCDLSQDYLLNLDMIINTVY